MKPPIPVAQLRRRHCSHLSGSGAAYAAAELEGQLREVPEWSVKDGALERTFRFNDYYGTIAFVNALAWIAHSEDHHPELTVGYDRCVVRWNTHSIGGISENDFICAAKAEALLGQHEND